MLRFLSLIAYASLTIIDGVHAVGVGDAKAQEICEMRVDWTVICVSYPGMQPS